MVKEREGRDPALQAVPEGFSWGAVIFREIWSLYRGAWFTTGVILVVVPVVTLLAQAAGLDLTGVLAVQFATLAILGFAANELRLMELGLRRYHLFTIVRAADLDEAEALGLIAWTRREPTERSAPPPPVETSAITGQPLWKPASPR